MKNFTNIDIDTQNESKLGLTDQYILVVFVLTYQLLTKMYTVFCILSLLCDPVCVCKSFFLCFVCLCVCVCVCVFLATVYDCVSWCELDSVYL